MGKFIICSLLVFSQVIAQDYKNVRWSTWTACNLALVSIIIPKVAELMQMCLDVFCHVMLCVSMCNIYASQKTRVNCEGVTCRFIGDIFVANLHLSAISQPWDDFIFYELFLFGRLIGFNAFFPLTRLFFSSSLNE